MPQFLEALCRVSQCKAFPTDEECGHAVVEGWLPDSMSNAGAYLLQMAANSPDSYQNFMQERRVPWPKLQSIQAVERCVEHLIHLLITHCHGGLARKPSLGWALTQRQVEWAFGGGAS